VQFSYGRQLQFSPRAQNVLTPQRLDSGVRYN